MARAAWGSSRVWAVLALASACTKVEVPETTNTANTLFEGDEPGECTDGADNDVDGYYDCGDIDCWGSPDCANTNQDADADTDADSDSDADADTDTDTDSDTDTDTDTNPDAVVEHLKGFDLRYSLSFDYADEWEDYLSYLGLSNCTTWYEGSSDEQVEAYGTRVTFKGAWFVDVPASDCVDDLQGAVWTDPGGTSYASFIFDEDVTELYDWYQHRDADDYVSLASPSEGGQWLITSIYSELEPKALTVHYLGSEHTTIEGLIGLDLYHDMTVTFYTE